MPTGDDDTELLKEHYGLRSPARTYDPYWLSPETRAPAEAWSAEAKRPKAPLDSAQAPYVGPGATLTGAFMAGQAARHAYESAKERDWWPAAELAGTTVLGAVMPMAPRGRGARMPLEQYVQGLKEREGHPVVNYDKYLEPQPIPESLKRMPTAEPGYARKEPPPHVQDLSSKKNVKELTKKADQGLMEGPEGYPVNPWYWPGPVYDAFVRHLGPEMGADRFDKFMGYNAATSMQTAVPRNIVEGFHALYNDLHGIPFSKLDPSELTGAAYNNKVMLLGDVAEGRGLTRPSAPKVRNYWGNLKGAGTEPVYELTTDKGKIEPRQVRGPVTLDSIMSDAMNYARDPESGKAKRFVGAPYRSGQDVVYNVADKFGSAPADTQAAIWQAHQFGRHGDDVYTLPYAGIFNDQINRIARETGKHPEKVLEDLLHGRERPPNFFTVKADGGGIEAVLADEYGARRKVG